MSNAIVSNIWHKVHSDFCFGGNNNHFVGYTIETNGKQSFSVHGLLSKQESDKLLEELRCGKVKQK